MADCSVKCRAQSCHRRCNSHGLGSRGNRLLMVRARVLGDVRLLSKTLSHVTRGNCAGTASILISGAGMVVHHDTPGSASCGAGTVRPPPPLNSAGFAEQHRQMQHRTPAADAFASCVRCSIAPPPPPPPKASADRAPLRPSPRPTAREGTADPAATPGARTRLPPPPPPAHLGCAEGAASPPPAQPRSQAPAPRQRRAAADHPPPPKDRAGRRPAHKTLQPVGATTGKAMLTATHPSSGGCGCLRHGPTRWRALLGRQGHRTSGSHLGPSARAREMRCAAGGVLPAPTRRCVRAARWSRCVGGWLRMADALMRSSAAS